MYSILALFTLLAPLALADKCHQDNCQRAVQRMWQGQQVYDLHMSQCRDNLGCVTTPAAATITNTQTVTSGTATVTLARATAAPTGPGAGVVAGQTCGSGKIPSDQSSQCNNDFASYSAACECAGQTGATVTAAQATATVVVQITQPASVIYV